MRRGDSLSREELGGVGTWEGIKEEIRPPASSGPMTTASGQVARWGLQHKIQRLFQQCLQKTPNTFPTGDPPNTFSGFNANVYISPNLIKWPMKKSNEKKRLFFKKYIFPGMVS